MTAGPPPWPAVVRCSGCAQGTLYCPACGINRLPNEEDDRTDPVDEVLYRSPSVEYVDQLDHWPGTGIGLRCPRCGIEAAPATAEAIVERLARRRPPAPGAARAAAIEAMHQALVDRGYEPGDRAALGDLIDAVPAPVLAALSAAAPALPELAAGAQPTEAVA